MPKTISYSVGATALIAASAAIATCRTEPAPSPNATSTSTTAGASGAGGDAGTAGDAAASATASATAGAPAGAPEGATSTAATGAPAPACQVPAPKNTTCDRDGDCWDGTTCTEDRCDLGAQPDPYGRRGTCRWTALPDGAGCDVSDGTDTCQRGACCPPGVLPPGADPPAGAAAHAGQLPEGR